MSEHGNGRHWHMTLGDLVDGSGGKAVSTKVTEFKGFGTDTRADLKNKVFIALKGDTFDAHDFLPKAVEAGAAALLVHKIPESAKAALAGVTVVQVDDTLLALQKLGNYWRRKMSATIIGLTGTNGKTTTKEFAAAVIGTKREVQYSKGSFNNHWGVPISLLSIDSMHEVAVIEMGMNHPGELKTLCAIAEPDIVMVTMVGRGHLEGVGSIEGVAKAKSEIYEHAPKSATRIFNLENEHTRKMYEKFGRDLPSFETLTFAGYSALKGLGLTTSANGAAASVWPAIDVALDVTSATPESIHVKGEIRGVGGETTIPVFGQHNVTNVMAAACLGLATGMTPDEVWTALPQCRNAWGRNHWVNLASGARVLFDGYNANPESMRAAVDNFTTMKPQGRKIAVLGEMKELGSHTGELHEELGRRVAGAGFDHVCFFGPSKARFEAGLKAAGFKKTSYFSDGYQQNLALEILPVLVRNDIVLIKGSRGMQLEKVLQDLKPLDFDAKK